jgi:uncharacterized RDD family membrane protein YckC
MKSIEFTTAQYVKIEYELASSGVRMLASLIDVIAFLIYYLIFYMLFGASLFTMGQGITELVVLILLRIPWFFYSPIIEYITRGQSLGKYILGIRVVSITGENAGLREYFTRWIFRVVDIWFGFGFLAILFSSTSERGQRLGDAMANTVVISKKNSQKYNLKNILNIRSHESHEVAYPTVVRFTDEDVMLIKTTLQRVEQYPNEETKKFTIQLATKTAELLGLETVPDKKIGFLKQVLMDYVVLTR